MKQQNSKLHKAVKGTGIAVKVVLVLCGVAILAFFGWLGVSICRWAGLIA